jgi:hypothetical protein
MTLLVSIVALVSLWYEEKRQICTFHLIVLVCVFVVIWQVLKGVTPILLGDLSIDSEAIAVLTSLCITFGVKMTLQRINRLKGSVSLSSLSALTLSQVPMLYGVKYAFDARIWVVDIGAMLDVSLLLLTLVASNLYLSKGKIVKGAGVAISYLAVMYATVNQTDLSSFERLVVAKFVVASMIVVWIIRRQNVQWKTGVNLRANE